MALTFQTGSSELNYNTAVLTPPWQRGNTSPLVNDHHSRKRKLEPIKTNMNKSQAKPPASQVTTFNRFSILETTEDSMNTTQTVNNRHTQRIPSPPPIFIDDVIDIESMKRTIEKDISKEDYKLKINNNHVKILPTHPDTYRKLTKLLKTLNAKFHTYQLKQERPFRVVLRNIHHSVDLDELKFELQTLGHEVTNISNIRYRVTKNPLLLFFVDLKQKGNNKEIYNVNRLMNSIVKFEPPLVKKEIVQCKRCQSYGHTQKYCNHNFRCVKCAGNNPTDQCTKSPETPAKCIHCQGEHPANYKGCSAYKTLHNIKYSKQGTMEITIQEPRPQKLTTPSISYAQATQGNVNNSKTHSEHTENSAPTPQNTDNFTRLEKLIEKQSEQINNLLSLFTLFMDKFIRTEAK